MKTNIYDRAKTSGAYFETDCVSCGGVKWDELMKGARPANKNKVIKIALLAGIIDEEQARLETKNAYYNPYTHYVTKTHIVYVHSGIEHFIKVN